MITHLLTWLREASPPCTACSLTLSISHTRTQLLLLLASFPLSPCLSFLCSIHYRSTCLPVSTLSPSLILRLPIQPTLKGSGRRELRMVDLLLRVAYFVTKVNNVCYFKSNRTKLVSTRRSKVTISVSFQNLAITMIPCFFLNCTCLFITFY